MSRLRGPIATRCLAAVLTWVLLAAMTTGASAQTSSETPSSAPGVQLPSTVAVLLDLDTIELEESTEDGTLAALTEQLERSIENSAPRLRPMGYRGLYCVDLFGDDRRALETRTLTRALEQLHDAPGVRFASPVRDFGGTTLVPTPELLLVLEPGVRSAVVVPRLERKGYRFIREYPGVTPILHVGHSGNGAQSEARAHALVTWPEVRSAEVNFIQHLVPLNVPNDPLFPDQWALENIGQIPGGNAGVDLNAPLAWDLSVGQIGVKIAILDEGVDLSHPDLAPRMGFGYDATDQPSPGGSPGNALPSDAHGTACAGLAAAAGNNGLGVTGVAWNATILPVRIGYAAHWSEVAWQVDAITWATDQGADILSNSWGGSAPSAAVRQAIEYSLTTGRGGLGCVLLFSAGNTDGSIVYPAKYPETIAIGATSPCDERKSPTSCDGVTTWGSCHGLELDLVAPGVHLATTDNQGAAGSDPGDFTFDFGGTSAACPIVAGATALLLALRPDLTADEVRAHLTSACHDQVGLPHEDTPGWDPFMGWGRLDLRALVDFATAPRPVEGLTTTVSGNDVTLSWNSPEPYQRVTVRRNGELLVTIIGAPESCTDLAAPAGDHRYTVVGQIGSAASPRAVSTALVVGSATDLVWSPPDARGAFDGGGALVEALAASGKPAVRIDDLRSVPLLDRFERVWISLGVYPDNHVLTEAEAIPLVEYLTNGVGGDSIYLEGSNTWAFDPGTSLHPYFGIDGFLSGGADLDTIVGFDVGTVDLSGFTLDYVGENAFIDRLLPIPPAVQILRNGPSPQFEVAIAHEASDYRTIGTSFELAGLENSTGARDALVATLLPLLEIPRTPFLRGDTNGTGVINLADAMQILAHLFRGSPTTCLDALDVDDNGAIDVADAVRTLDHLFGAGPPPALPFPAIDIDPDDLDPLDCVQYP